MIAQIIAYVIAFVGSDLDAVQNGKVLVALVIGLASGKSVYAVYGLGLIAALLFFTWFFIMVVYRVKYEAKFVFDEKGVLCRTQASQAKKNRLISGLFKYRIFRSAIILSIEYASH